jgi:hypothetical protein
MKPRRISPAAAARLAVDYHNFQTAARSSDWSGLLTWGPCLKRAQEAAGVELVRGYDIDLLAAHAARQPQPRPFYEEGTQA